VIPVLIGGGLLGLMLLLIPRALMLFGTRWTLRDGDTAEPSDAYVLYVRVFGVAVLVATAGLAWWVHSIEAESERRAELEELWDVSLLGSDEIVLITDPDVQRFDEFPEDLAEGSVRLETTRSAVVGEDELGGLGDVSSLDDGDLLVGTGYTVCTPIHLIVVEDSESVMVRIVGQMPVYDGPEVVLPGAETPGVETSDTIDQLNAWLFCSQRFINEDEPGLSVFRVPLEQPLGDRVLE